jgi:hypothetical protein
MRKLDMPDIKKEWKSIFQTMDKKNLRLDEKEIAKKVRPYRKEKRKRSTG